jgi:SSS family solute:Na+ symporter
MGLAIASLTGINTHIIIWVIGFVVIYITLRGGIEGVIWLDVIQGFLLIGGGLLAIGIIIFSIDGGIIRLFEVAIENQRISFVPYTWDFAKLTFFVMVFNGLFYGIQKYGTDQTIVQRYLTARSEKGAVRASLTGLFVSLPVWTLFMFVGTSLFVYYQVNPGLLPADISSDAVFPYFIMTEIPIGLTGLIISALMAASISSLDSDLNCLSAIAVEDYYIRFKKDATDQEKLKFGKKVIVVFGLLSLMVASLYVYMGSEGILGIIFGLYAIFSGGIAGIFILGTFSKRANKQGLYIAILITILFTGYAVLTSKEFNGTILLDLGNWNFPHHEYMIGVYSHLIIIFVGYLASFLFPSAEVHEDLTIHARWNKRK